MREQDRELQRAYRTISDLRQRVDALERALAAAHTALRPHVADPRSGKARPYTRVSDSGQPIFDEAG
jgi:hypothetical protein